MPDWAIWIAAAALCVAVEIFTPSFFILWFGVGALAASLSAGLGAGTTWQFGVFLVISAILIPWTKNISSRWMGGKSGTKTNIYGLVGKKGHVTQTIGECCFGLVRVEGEVWTARGLPGVTIPLGSRVRVLEVKGVHLVVEDLGEEGR